MSKKWKNRRLKVAAALVFLVGPGIGIASAQTTPPTAQVINVTDAKDIVATPAAAQGEDPYIKKFLDKDGGYTDKLGGYYNPKAGTYTDAKGGVVDNWQGYTYKDGSYKSKNGDYYDAPKKTIHLAAGDVFEKPADMADAEVIKTLRGNVEDSGGYNKDYIHSTMVAQIKAEHPPTPPLAAKP